MKDRIEETAIRLRTAYTDGPVAPLRGAIEPEDSDAAYAVQEINTRFWQTAGRRVVGAKVGLTSKAVQLQLGVSQPDFGVLFDDMRIPDTGVLDLRELIQPKVEAEIAFVLKDDLGREELTDKDVRNAVGSVHAAIEIVDSRIEDWKITFADTVADNGSSARFVLGREGVEIRDLDMWSCGMVMQINQEVVSIGAGAACLGNPLNSAVWLARTLYSRGRPLVAGDVILTGALGPMVSLKPGDEVQATIGGVGRVGFSVKGASQ